MSIDERHVNSLSTVVNKGDFSLVLALFCLARFLRE
jgi:hypothetical protein